MELNQKLAEWAGFEVNSLYFDIIRRMRDIMSVENFKKFGQMCAEKEDVRKKAKEIGIDNLDGVVAYGKKLGLDFSLDDIKALGDEAGITDQELSDEELEKVAGGFVTTTAAVVAGGIGGALGGAATVATAAGAW